MKSKNYYTAEESLDLILKNPEIKKSYDRLVKNGDLRNLLLEARSKAHLTQIQLAEILKTNPSSISRLEKNPIKARFQTIYNYLYACNFDTELILKEKLINI